MANVQKRGDSYLIRAFAGYDTKGKQIVKSFTWNPDKKMTSKQLEKELERQIFIFEEKIRNGEIIGSGNIKLSDFCPQYLDLSTEKLSPLTKQLYERIIERHIIPKIGHLKLKDIKPVHVQRFIQELSQEDAREDGKDKKLSPSTIRRYLNVLQSIFNLACKMELISSNPTKAEKLTLPHKIFPKIEIFTKDEASKMLELLDNEPLKYQVLVHLAIILGARRGELMALKWGNINFNNNLITIAQSNYKLTGKPIQSKLPKDYEVRIISASEYSIELLKQLKKEQEYEAERLGDRWHYENWLFTQWDGAPMNVTTPTKWFTKFLKKYDLPHRKFHALRHSSATFMLCSGVNIKTVANRLGHADISTTNKYLHSLADADVAAANALQDMLISHTSALKSKKAN